MSTELITLQCLCSEYQQFTTFETKRWGVVRTGRFPERLDHQVALSKLRLTTTQRQCLISSLPPIPQLRTSALTLESAEDIQHHRISVSLGEMKASPDRTRGASDAACCAQSAPILGKAFRIY
jgi:hypothetical protein